MLGGITLAKELWNENVSTGIEILMESDIEEGKKKWLWGLVVFLFLSFLSQVCLRLQSKVEELGGIFTK